MLVFGVAKLVYKTLHPVFVTERIKTNAVSILGLFNQLLARHPHPPRKIGLRCATGDIIILRKKQLMENLVCPYLH